MKLIGSKTECDYREILIKSHKRLFEENGNERLLNILLANFPQMKTAYVIVHNNFEEGKDIYGLLINIDVIVTIELDHYDLTVEPIIVEIESVNDYKRGLSKSSQIQLAVALDLAQKDMKMKFDK